MDIAGLTSRLSVFSTILALFWRCGAEFLRFRAEPYAAYIGATLLPLLVPFTFTPPHIPVANQQKKPELTSMLGLDAFALFKISDGDFLHLSMMLGANSRQITNMFGNTFLHSFDKDPLSASSFIVQHARR